MKVIELLELAKKRSEKDGLSLENAFLCEIFENAWNLAYSSNRDDLRVLLQELAACLSDSIQGSSLIENLKEYHPNLFED